MYDRCRHLRVGGERCEAMALKDKAFCYFHLHHRRKPAKSKPSLPDAAPAVMDFELPLLEDRHAIQIGITQIARALAANEIDPRRAGLLLYALQIASSNLRDSSSLSPENVRRVVLTATNDEIAPARTIFEAQDLNKHKKGCSCKDCVFTQEDNETHHPGCECGDAWFHQPQPPAAANTPAAANPPETLTIQAVAAAGIEKSCHPERSAEAPGAPFKPAFGLSGSGTCPFETKGWEPQHSIGRDGSLEKHILPLRSAQGQENKTSFTNFRRQDISSRPPRLNGSTSNSDLLPKY